MPYIDGIEKADWYEISRIVSNISAILSEFQDKTSNLLEQTIKNFGFEKEDVLNIYDEYSTSTIANMEKSDFEEISIILSTISGNLYRNDISISECDKLVQKALRSIKILENEDTGILRKK